MERDPLRGREHRRYRDFNSHAHVERDGLKVESSHEKGISTHTLTWSVTFTGIVLTMPVKISTHTLTWSVTLIVRSGIGRLFISTHTLTWSVTRGVTGSGWKDSFQLTRSRGA